MVKHTRHKKEILTPPHPRARAKSLPVPRGKTPTAGGGEMPIWSNIESTQPTVPSPPHARIRRFGTFRKSSRLLKEKRERFEKLHHTSRKEASSSSCYPIFGPPCVKSNTWRGFRSHWNFWSNLDPWLPPLLGFMNTSTGVVLGFGMGLITKVLFSFSLDFFLPADFFLGGFLNDDLKLPFLGNLTIHDGGTIIREWIPINDYGDVG